MKTLIISVFLALSLNCYSQVIKSGWERIQNPTHSKLNKITFLNTDTGFIIGADGVILKTTDSGSSWIQLVSNTTENLVTIQFVTKNTGYILGNNGAILKTTNKGDDWLLLNPIPNIVISSPPTGMQAWLNWEKYSVAYFIDENSGYVFSNYSWTSGLTMAGARTLLTTNGGQNWISVSPLVSAAKSVIHVNDSILMIADCYHYSAYYSIYKLVNNKCTRIYEVNYNSTNQSITSLFSLNDSVIFFVGDQIIGKTTNQGNTWQTINLDAKLNAISFLKNNGFAVGDGIYHSKDSGESWLKQPIASTVNLSSIFQIDSLTAICVGDTEIYKTTTGGASLSIQLPDTVQIGCGEYFQINPDLNYDGQKNLTYSWDPKEGLSEANIAQPSVVTTQNRTYTLSVTDSTNLLVKDSIKIITIPSIDINPSICIVSVNDNDENIVIWDKSQNSAIDSIYVYRESSVQTDQYDLIGKLQYSMTGIFIDSASNAIVQSNKYEIAYKDICGFTTGNSAAHKTIHLNINKAQGDTWNLIWEPYEGFFVNSYKLYRGTSRSNLTLVGSTSGSNTSYSDLFAPSGDVYYQIEALSPNSCNNITGIYNTDLKSTTSTSSKSNIASNSINEMITISPIPAKIEINVDSKVTGKCKISVLSIAGHIEFSFNHTIAKNNKVDISNLSPGVYFLVLSNDMNTFYAKFIKE